MLIISRMIASDGNWRRRQPQKAALPPAAEAHPASAKHTLKAMRPPYDNEFIYIDRDDLSF